MSNPKRPVSPVEEFIKAFHEMSARYGRSELWYDYIDMHAIALANTCDLRCRDAREERYKAIVQKYDEKTVQQFAVLTAITMTALLENPEQDFLGTVYHNLGLSKSQAGQFFTPYNVGQMMARINMPDSLVLDKSRILRVNDPCCGAGCLLLAGYNVMREQLESTDPDWDKYVLFVAQDIDPLVCKMCYINLSNALALIDKPVWVITEVRGRNKNNRTYSKSRSKNVIYPATITNVQVWRGYSHSKGDTGCPKCTVTVDIATKDDTGTEIYFDLPNELLNVTVFESKEDAEKELAYLNSNKNTMTYSEQRQREDKNNAKVFGIT